MYCRSFSKPVSGDGTGAEDDDCGAALLVVVLGEPPPPHRTNSTLKRIIRTALFIAESSQRLINLLVPNVHDRTLRILVNNIKPSTQSRMFKEVVVLVV